MELRTDTRLAFHGDGLVVLFNDVFNNRQTQSRSGTVHATGFVYRIKALPYVFKLVFGDSDTEILYRDPGQPVFHDGNDTDYSVRI
jgi:hypothetical protein